MNTRSSKNFIGGLWRTTALLTVLAGLTLAQNLSAATNYAGSTTISFAPTPVVLSGDATADVTITSTTTSASGSAYINCGKVSFQYAVDNLTDLNPVSSTYVGLVWANLSPNNLTPVGGQASINVDLDALKFVPGTTGAFRAHYVKGSCSPGGDAVATHHSLGTDLTIPLASACADEDEVVVEAVLASGNGSPAPGDSGPWTFDIKVTNCTGVSLTGIKVQGGTNGWGYLVSTDPAFGTTPGSNPFLKSNKRNEILTWVIDLIHEESDTLSVVMNGLIKEGHSCAVDPDYPNPGDIEFVSGAWSAVYDAGFGKEKSEYSGRVSLTVTCPAP